MDIMLPFSQHFTKVHFDAAGEAFLQKQIDADEKFQRQLKCVAAVAGAILFAGGLTTVCLAIAAVIPYGFLGMCVTIVSSIVLLIGLVILVALGSDITIVKPTSTFHVIERDFYRELKKDLNCKHPVIRHKIDEKYIIKCYKAYLEYLEKSKEKVREVLEEQLTQDAPRNPSTNEPIYDFSHLVGIVEGYLNSRP